MDFMDLLHYLQNLKMLLSWLVIFGIIDTKSSWQEMSWKLWESCEYIGYGISKVFVKLLEIELCFDFL